MKLEKARLYHVRNYQDEVFFFHPGLNLILGNNAQGKTNLLESVYIACIGKAFRTSRLKDILKLGETQYELRLIFNDNQTDWDFRLRGNARERVMELNNQRIENRAQLFGRFPMVLFSPEHLRMVREGPAARRGFLDREMSLQSKVYFYELIRYNKTLAERNALLKMPDFDLALMDIYDEQLVTSGRTLHERRKVFLERLNEEAARIHHEFTGGAEQLRLHYESDLAKPFDPLQKLRETRGRDRKLGTTGFGIHLDDFAIDIGGIDVRRFGSQGQVRLSALSIFLGLSDLIEDILQTKPMILLDDVFSELDRERKANVLQRLAGFQTLITATDTDGLAEAAIQTANIIHIHDGHNRGGDSVQ